MQYISKIKHYRSYIYLKQVKVMFTIKKTAGLKAGGKTRYFIIMRDTYIYNVLNATFFHIKPEWKMVSVNFCYIIQHFFSAFSYFCH